MPFAQRSRHSEPVPRVAELKDDAFRVFRVPLVAMELCSLSSWRDNASGNHESPSRGFESESGTHILLNLLDVAVWPLNRQCASHNVRDDSGAQTANNRIRKSATARCALCGR
jgi:hypothetical protein